MRIASALAALAVASSAACGGGGATPSAPSATPTPGPSAGRPNLVLVLLDDAEYAMVTGMPRLRAQFIDRGVSFTNAIANMPLCGPARSVILAGQYAHNTGVLGNVGADGGYEAWKSGGYDNHNLGVWLKAAGYRTGLYGKYQNDFPTGSGDAFVPQGWDDWRGVMSDREASNDLYTLNENGRLTVYRAETGGYQTDILRDRVLDFLRTAENNDAQPFFVYFSLNAPHTPTTPAQRHLSAFPGVQAPRGPSFDEADISDKPSWLQEQATRLTASQVETIDRDYRGSLQALLAVEDAMDQLLQLLDQLGESQNTYVVFTSDNGLHRGEHRIPGGKQSPYEESARIPLFVRGPSVPAGRAVEHVVGHVDIAPTLLTLAGAALQSNFDGVTLTPLLGATPPATASWRQEILIEAFGGGAPFRIPRYAALRSATEMYMENARGDAEYYDLRTDPNQVNNLASRASSATISRLSARLAELANCAGATCRN